MPLSRREFIAATAAPALLPAAAASRRPNFIVIVADDLGCHDLGCLGAPDLKTPHIDALAASGVQVRELVFQCPGLRSRSIRNPHRPLPDPRRRA